MFFRKHWFFLMVLIMAICGVGLYYLQTRPPKEPIVIIKPVEPLPKSEVKVPTVRSTTAQLREPQPVDTFGGAQVSKEFIGAPPRDYSKGAGNPSPFENVPVDLYDFKATKATMTAHLNFFMANWDPKVYNREVNISMAIISNIDNAARATQLGLFTPEQAAEIHAVHDRYFDFKGVERGRIPQLMDEGYTRDEAGRIASEELLERWGVK